MVRPYSISVVELPAAVHDMDLVMDFMRFRKRVFVDRMEWPLIHSEGVEFEQYDTLNTCYILAHEGRSVIGGARVKPTSATNGRGVAVYSYMIRDAYLGLLPGMPTELCNEEPPVDPDVWELTRFVAQEKPVGVAEAILKASNEYLYNQNAKTCLFLGPPAFMRMAKRLGWTPVPLGPIVGNKDGRFLAFGCDVVPPEQLGPVGGTPVN